MSSHFLYEKWVATARAFKHETALIDTSSEKSWTFDELLREGEGGAISGAISFPKGSGPEFIFTLLNSWRTGVITCPLEAAQSIPECTNLPTHIAHLKLTSATSGSAK